jgi:hypothetical protein
MRTAKNDAAPDGRRAVLQYTVTPLTGSPLPRVPRLGRPVGRPALF